MEFNKPIADMLPGMDVEGFYILRAAALKTTNNGKPFLSGTICDRTGSVEIKIWDYSGPIGARPDDTGRVVKIRGSVSEYRGALQISVHRIRMAEAADDYDTALLVPTAPIDADAHWRTCSGWSPRSRTRITATWPRRCWRGTSMHSGAFRPGRACTTVSCPAF